MEIWFRRDFVRSFFLASPEASDVSVCDALRHFGVEASLETVRRDRLLWGLPSGTAQRRRRGRGNRPLRPRPAPGSVGQRLIGELLLRGPGTPRELSERVGASLGSVRASLKAHSMFTCRQRRWHLIGSPGAYRRPYGRK